MDRGSTASRRMRRRATVLYMAVRSVEGKRYDELTHEQRLLTRLLVEEGYLREDVMDSGVFYTYTGKSFHR
ncbi:MAG: hypothetical protein IJ026_05865 [Candidatus Methanomethylophilaceae archaeon]|nr:hypothetical protein [Candidatus Methanomethylophilaceae archaeon]